MAQELEETYDTDPDLDGVVAVQHLVMSKHARRCKGLEALASAQGHAWHFWELWSGSANFTSAAQERASTGPSVDILAQP